MSNLTYFLFIDDSSLDISPDEEMEEYLREHCPIPSDEELEKLEKEMQIKMNEILHTKWGTARISNYGYWRITSSKKGNTRKYLHRLIFEDYHKCTLLPGAVIHHMDGNKLNNRIENLELMSREAHLSLHNKGENHHMFGKSHSDESRQKMSESHKGKKLSDETKQKISESRNTSGYLNVYKNKDKRCKQGFTWIYSFYDENGIRKVISSVSLDKLEAKVKKRGLRWKKFEKEE